MSERRPSPRRVAIRYKLAAAMAIPLVALSAVVTFEVMQLNRETGEVRRHTDLATAADGPSGLIHSLQNERNWAVVELIGQGGLVTVEVEGYEETRNQTDDALAGFQESLEGGQDRTIEAYAPAVEALTGLEPLRDEINANQGPRTLASTDFADEVFAAYAAMIDPFLEGTTAIAVGVEHPGLRQGAALIDASNRQVEVVANLARRTIAYALLTEGGIDSRDEINDLSTLLGQLRRYRDTIASSSTGHYGDLADDSLFVDFTDGLATQVDAAMASGQFDLAVFLDAVTVPNEDSYNGYRAEVGEILRAEAGEIDDRATQRQRLLLVLVVVVVAVALLGMVVVARSITLPLQSLTHQAVEMAQHHLTHAIEFVLRTRLDEDVSVPRLRQIEADSNDEVGDVADALNSVQDSALDLAVGQAVMRKNLADTFVNLGRRNQSLLSRQLDFITQLEHEAVNPDTLAHLFQLDHLATRMRRNAESLLVLAGTESPRSWSAPVRAADLIRAAVSEVEHYQRVAVPMAEPVAILGSAAADIAHLLAELLENALLYSPSDDWVEIRGLRQPAGYTLAVIDRGLGMSPEEIARANRRLAGSESFTISPSKYLGLYVAGNLAARHGIRVRLQASEGSGGITATVHLPGDLVSTTNGAGSNGATAPTSITSEGG